MMTEFLKSYSWQPTSPIHRDSQDAIAYETLCYFKCFLLDFGCWFWLDFTLWKLSLLLLLKLKRKEYVYIKINTDPQFQSWIHKHLQTKSYIKRNEKQFYYFKNRSGLEKIIAEKENFNENYLKKNEMLKWFEVK